VTAPINLEFEFDSAELAKAREMMGPKLFEKAMADVRKSAILAGDAAAKRATPYDLGHAKRSTVADLSRMTVEGRYPYLDWLDTGEDGTGRRIRDPRGGYRIREFTRDVVNDALPVLMDKAGRKIAERWARS